MPGRSIVRFEPGSLKWCARIMSNIISAVWNGLKQFTAQLTETNSWVLIDAVKRNDVECLSRLLRQLRHKVLTRREFETQYLEYVEQATGWTALMHAAALGHAECVYLLLDGGASHSHGDFTNRQPIHLACKNGHVRSAKMLLSQNADPFVEDADACTALDYALRLDDSNVEHQDLVHTIVPHGILSAVFMMKISRWPLRKTWEPRWVLVTPRRSRQFPTGLPRLTMAWFKSANSFKVLGKVWLTAATLEMSEAEASLLLSRGHEKPTDAYYVTDAQQRHVIQLRAEDSISQRALVVLADTLRVNPELPSQQGTSPQQRLPSSASPLQGGSSSSTASPGASAAANSTSGNAAEDEALARRLQEEYDNEAAAFAGEEQWRDQGPLGQGATGMQSEPLQPNGRRHSSPIKERLSFKNRPAKVVLQSAGSNSDDNQCLICQDQEITSGFLHGSSIHKCVCKGCAQMYVDRKLPDCPMCRVKITQVVLDIY